MLRHLVSFILFLSLLTGPAAMANHQQQPGRIRVNNQALDARTVQLLVRAYGQILPGAYWYDPMSGLWGVMGGPSIGRIRPGLRLGGRLSANASGGGHGRMTAVFVNGREFHPQEYFYLKALFGVVVPGRYWLGPDLVGGLEGRAASFDLKRAAAQRGGGGYNRRSLFGGLMSDGQCSGYLHPNGTSVMSGNC